MNGELRALFVRLTRLVRQIHVTLILLLLAAGLQLGLITATFAGC